MSIVKVDDGEVVLETVGEPTKNESIVATSVGRRQLYKEIVGIENRSAADFVGNPKNMSRDFSFDSGMIDGLKGDTLTLVFRPGILFRIDKFMLTDTYQIPGTGTAMSVFTIDGRINLPLQEARTSRSFQSRTWEIKFDVCRPSSSIEFRILFLRSCTFYMALFGKGVL